MLKSAVVVCTGVALILGLSAVCPAGDVTAIFATSGSLSGVPGDPSLSFVSFDRPVRSPNGQFWALLARTNAPSASDAIYLTGQGTIGTVRVREGVTELEPGRTAESMADRRIGINNIGDFAIPANLTGSTADDAVIVKGFAAGGFVITAREGSPVPAAAGLPPGTTYGLISNSVNSVQLTTLGNPSFTAPVVGSGITSSNDLSFFRPDGSLALREGVAPYGNGVSSSFYVDATGTRWLAQANVAGAPTTSDDGLWVDGVNVLREGFEVHASMPSATYGTVSSFYLPTMESNGDWFARGRTNLGFGFAVKNGAVLAKTGDAVPGGDPGEVWSSAAWTYAASPTFFHLSGNNNGDYILGGFTSNPDGTRNAAWVLNNSEVVLRSGDQVDLNGDGVLDNAFIYFAGPASGASPTFVGGFLTDDLWFYFNSDIRDAFGNDLGDAFLRVRVPEPGAFLLVLIAAAGLRRR